LGKNKIYVVAICTDFQSFIIYMKQLLFIFIALIISQNLLIAQNKNWRKDDSYYLSATKYISPDNPFYWKKRKPFMDYWQQDVHYRILCNLQPDYNMIEGRETLTYRNNSPDRLDVLYFNLYQNAYTKGSYMDKMYQQQGKKLDFGDNAKGTEIGTVMHEGKPAKIEMDNTIMKVYLNTPLGSGEVTNLDIDFVTYFSQGDADRRMKMFPEKVSPSNSAEYEVTHYDIVHWYPRVAVYDRRFKWCIDQHLGHEFYGDFGSFEVHLTLPEYYIIEATGVLQNEKEVLPESLKLKIDLTQFANKANHYSASEIIPKDNSKTKCWVYHAHNVHDFAITADPTYRRKEVKLGDISCIALARERKADKWLDAAEYTAKFINIYNSDIGKYLYPKMVVADADDGMEYPMLTLDGGESPSYYGLLAHEVGHNWFYGMVGNNETYRAFLDEGFTQFLTVWSMEKVIGKYDPSLSKFKKLTGKTATRYTEAYGPYLKAAIHNDDGILNTHSDDFGAVGNSPDYGQVYTKTATMLYNLKYVLGEETFLNSMRYYFNKWKFKHPYPEDFRATIIEYTKADLNWFFDQWMDTDKKIDYKVKSVRPLPEGKTALTFERKGAMQMPLDFVVTTPQGNFKYHIPITEYIKNDTTLISLPKWQTRGTLNPQYTVIIPKRVRNIVIDPQHLMADVNLMNNSRRPPIKIVPQLYPKIDYLGSWEHYKINIRPNIWWNGFSGAQAGITLSGNYMNEFHNFTANVWYNTGLGKLTSPSENLQKYTHQFHRISYRFNYKNLVPALGKNAYIEIGSRFMEGLHYHGAGLSYKVPKGASGAKVYNRLYAKYLFMYRTDSAYLDYLILANNWLINRANASITVGFERRYGVTNGTGLLDVYLRTSAFGSQSNYSYLTMDSRHGFTLGKMALHTRLFGRYGIGNLPVESALYLAGGSPEEMQNNAFYRARGFFPSDWSVSPDQKTGHAHFAGGLNLRGYTGTIPALTDGTAAWYGSAGAAANIEWDFNRLIPILRNSNLSQIAKFRSYFFYDGGILGKNVIDSNRFIDKTNWGKLHHDAGIGATLDIGNDFSKTQLLTLRSDFPIYVSRPTGAQKNLDFRWLVSVSKLF
jgi:Peptidase family M1 domain